MFTSYLVPTSGSSTPSVNNPTLITDAVVITAIKLDANWNADGNYTGSTTGIVDDSYYYDSTFNFKYEYKDTLLRRFQFNPITL